MAPPAVIPGSRQTSPSEAGRPMGVLDCSSARTTVGQQSNMSNPEGCANANGEAVTS
jgi:hypothetical protein